MDEPSAGRGVLLHLDALRRADNLRRGEDTRGALDDDAGCELCAGVCPAQCIYVRGEDNPEDNPVSPGERYGFIYEINMLRCIYCALCVEACPTEAITMTSLFEMSVANRSEAIFDKSVLVVNDDGTPNTHEEQTKLTNIEDLQTSDGWMRATSPNGNPNFENIVNWSGSLGVGKKDPEKNTIC